MAPGGSSKVVSQKVPRREGDSGFPGLDAGPETVGADVGADVGGAGGVDGVGETEVVGGTEL